MVRSAPRARLEPRTAADVAILTQSRREPIVLTDLETWWVSRLPNPSDDFTIDPHSPIWDWAWQRAIGSRSYRATASGRKSCPKGLPRWRPLRGPMVLTSNGTSSIGAASAIAIWA